jgi:hypothetical protein
MKEKRAEISYTFEELSAGGRVRIKTTNPEALKAIHDFLRYCDVRCRPRPVQEPPPLTALRGIGEVIMHPKTLSGIQRSRDAITK